MQEFQQMLEQVQLEGLIAQWTEAWNNVVEQLGLLASTVVSGSANRLWKFINRLWTFIKYASIFLIVILILIIIANMQK